MSAGPKPSQSRRVADKTSASVPPAFRDQLGRPPEWLEQAWTHATGHGLDKLTEQDVDDEIQEYRKEKHRAPPALTK